MYAFAPVQLRASLLRSLPGIGLTTALTIAGDTGDPTRFPDAHHYVAYCGLAPATHQSGASGPSAKPRHRYDRHLKRAFLLLALVQVRWQPAARAYYDRKRAEGKAHWVALRCLARQLCRIVFRMLTHSRPYHQPSTTPTWSSDSLQVDRKGGPILPQLVPTAAKGPRHPQGRSERQRAEHPAVRG